MRTVTQPDCWCQGPELGNWEFPPPIGEYQALKGSESHLCHSDNTKPFILESLPNRWQTNFQTTTKKSFDILMHQTGKAESLSKLNHRRLSYCPFQSFAEILPTLNRKRQRHLNSWNLANPFFLRFFSTNNDFMYLCSKIMHADMTGFNSWKNVRHLQLIFS